MAAVIHHHDSSLAPAFRPAAPAAARPVRPVLRVIEGGRSPAVLAARAATFRRRRIVAALGALTLVTLLVLGVQALAGLAGTQAGPTGQPISGPTVVVEAETGDTLWSIARQVRPEGDVRPLVDAMVNERGSAEIRVGDQVRVPAA